MTESAEHQFISHALDKSLAAFAETKLLGLSETQRRTFDYGCVLLRDLSRPLVSQVLWTHQEGIEKDIRTLVFDGGSSLKLYFVRDNVRNRARIDEIVTTYRNQPSTAPLLRGLRIVPVPDSFDADSEAEQKWMHDFIRDRVTNDLLFAVIFGKLTTSDVAAFSDHGGPLGLKFAVLHLVTSEGLWHGPSFEATIGTRGSPLREVLTMLSSVGLIGRIPKVIMKVPTLKGRFMLDLSKRIMYERTNGVAWSSELRLMLRHVGAEPPPFEKEIDQNEIQTNIVSELLSSMQHCKSQYGIDLMARVNTQNPSFYSEFDWQKFVNGGVFKITADFWNSSDDLDLFSETRVKARRT